MPRSKTTSIPRPVEAPAADVGRSRLGDFTRPIPVEKRISQRPRVALFTGLFALGILAFIAIAVFVLPVGTWRSQGVDLDQRQAQLDELQRVNNELEAETIRLETPDGIREAAREDYGFVEIGENRATVLPLPPLPTLLPAGWPYNVVTQIMTVRSTES
ncbi:FtsB family cell division protein [Ilumatobacter sp.]|uniref:FtsB family cell division protein n=1 Tax=Ilumatobacter sp. TaxID=1967498 RepID=UPI003C446CB9